MKIVRYCIGKQTGYGILRGDTVQAILGKPFRSVKLLDRFHKLSEVKLLAPVSPSKVVAAAKNYRSLLPGTAPVTSIAPEYFIKPSTSVIGPGDEITYFHSLTRVDFEGELAAIIGRKAARVPEGDALDYVFGYTCLNDVSAPDVEGRGRSVTKVKALDTFCPLGPVIETELDPINVEIETYLNGKRVQKGNTSKLIFSMAELISAISHVITLLPGDVVASGTPDGYGPMFPGDTVEVRIPQIGSLINPVVLGPLHAEWAEW